MDDEKRSAADMGFDPGMKPKLLAGIEAGLLRDLHAVLVSRDGKLVLEQYREAPDESWGMPLGTVAFDAGMLHDLRSVTKSVVSLRIWREIVLANVRSA